MDKIVYLLVLTFGFLSVYNFLRDLEVDSRVVQLEKRPQVFSARERRDATQQQAEDLQKIFNFEELNKYIQKQSNQTFQNEINQALMKFMTTFPIENICKKFVSKCAKGCEEEEKIVFGDDKVLEKTRTKCMRGPQGPPGPPGPKGLGLVKPELIKNTLDKGVVNLTDSKTFECKFFGSPIPEVSWKSPKSRFIVNDTIDKESSTITSRLYLSNISWDDQGPVECRATSLLGEDFGTGKLTTLSKPVISMNKKLLFAPERINFTFPECKVRSNPTAKVTWKRIFWSMPSGRVDVRKNKLTINNVQYSDEGFYVCEAENYLGKDKKTVQLKIKPFEMHKASPSQIYIPSGDKTKVFCSAYGNTQEMTGTITNSGETLSSYEERREENLFKIQANVTTEGTYVCTIENKKEKVESATLVKMFTLASSLLSSSQQSTIGKELKKMNKIGKYKKCFGLSSPSTSFYTSCGGKKDTLTIFRIKDSQHYDSYYGRYKYRWGSNYIGGFTDIPWQQGEEKKYSNFTVLFDFNQQKAYPAIDGKRAVCYYDGYGPCFGDKDIYVSSSGNIYYASPTSFSQLPSVSSGMEVQFETFYKV